MNGKVKELWKSFSNEDHELRPVKERLSEEDVSSLLNLGVYYDLLKIPFPSTTKKALERFVEEGYLSIDEAKMYSIAYLGALLFAKDLNDFSPLSRKGIRLLGYQDESSLHAYSDINISKGYASSFFEAIPLVMALLGKKENISSSLREEILPVPEVVIREAIGNLLAHQGMETNESLRIEIHPGRIEFSNPGSLLIDVDKLIGDTPFCRNTKLLRFLRNIGICEDRGSGFDRIEEALSFSKMPSVYPLPMGNSFKLIVILKKGYQKMSDEEKVNTAYTHCCYCYEKKIPFNNATLRERLGIEKQNAALASRILSYLEKQGKIRKAISLLGTSSRDYLPYWA